MITKVNNSTDAIQAFNENLDGLLTGKRKRDLVKETNNTLGKLCSVIKMHLMHKAITGDISPLDWFDGGVIKLLHHKKNINVKSSHHKDENTAGDEMFDVDREKDWLAGENKQ